MSLDLGRHIKNGEIILSSFGHDAQWKEVLYENFYSSFFSSTPFVNHHWLGGVIFYLVYALAGFVGLNLFFTAVSLMAFFLFFYVAKEEVGYKLAVPVAFFMTPLIAERVEIRPEVFSYLFAAVFLFCLWKLDKGRIKFWILCVSLPLVEMLWVNSHIYFFVGPTLVGIFFLVYLARGKKQKMKQTLCLLSLVILAGIMNPYGLAGFLYPLRVFENYGLLIMENLSVPAFAKIAPLYINILFFKLSFAIFILLSAAVFWLRRRSFPWAIFLATLLFGLMTWRMMRNMTIYGFFVMVAIAILLKLILSHPFFAKLSRRRFFPAVFTLVIILFTIYISFPRLNPAMAKSGLGVYEGNDYAAKFILDNNISGPLFNDSDSGSYVIFHLFPFLQPFADNRPEAYPPGFYSDTYISSQTTKSVWEEIDKKYEFNVIVYSLEDNTPWAVPFIIDRLDDSRWAPVYTDNYAIIFLKRNKLNESLVRQFEIPRSAYSVSR